MQSRLFALRKAPNIMLGYPVPEDGEYGQGFVLEEPSDSTSDELGDARRFVKPCDAESCDADAIGAKSGGGGGSPFLEQ